jgi:hypothetical protein
MMEVPLAGAETVLVLDGIPALAVLAELARIQILGA